MGDEVTMLNLPKKPSGLVIAAPHSGSGKTSLTIGLLRALSRRGVAVSPAKIGPDYIDPQFHEVACGRPSFNLDGWAMQEAHLAHLGSVLQSQNDFTLIEGVMGLFDGAVKPGVLGHGATADIARFFDLPVVLVVDCAGMGQSVAALVKGFASFDPSLKLSGVILNKLGSLRHVAMMEGALKDIGVKVLGAVPRCDEMELPSRHLGLVQASETENINQKLDVIADHIEAHISLDEMLAAAGVFGPVGGADALFAGGVEPLGDHIAVASDDAFRFFYPHIRQLWEGRQVKISLFSPLQDEAPDRQADAVYLPGGYPELFAGRLASNDNFMNGLRQTVTQGKRVYGECGGYMVMGQGLIDKAGGRHKMAGLLNLETSFEARKLHLGYRHVRRCEDGALFRGHEFHYATILREEGPPLFEDVAGSGHHGLAVGAATGSFVHMIDAA